MNDNQDKKQKAKEKYHNGGGKERSKSIMKQIKKLLKKKQKLDIKICLKNRKK